MAKFNSYAQVIVALTGCPYAITICKNALLDTSYLSSLIQSKQICIVTNEIIAPLYLAAVQSCFKERRCDVVILADGEHFKNQESLATIYNTLVENRHHRDTTLIALGGGVVCDITGFAAATYQRGVSYIQIPTTLLAQVDAAVGGKTAINHPLGKNMIGSFYQPKAVIVDLNTLTTLPIREFKAGLAEVIKYALLVGGDFLLQLEHSLSQGLNADSPELLAIITQCCQIKAQIVATDEKETGLRALLNLGHTFAHALESYTNYQRWRHGEAVAIGLHCAAILSNIMGLLDQSTIDQIKRILTYAGLPYSIPREINLERLISLMEMDKKIKNNALHFVVIRKPGDCYLENKITQEWLYKTLITAVEGE